MNKSVTFALTLALALMGVGGFAMGWLAFGIKRHENAGAPPLEATSSNTSSNSPSDAGSRPVEVERRYVLRPEDVQADRETPAIAADEAGHVVVAWASQTGELERTIFLLRSTDGGANFAPPIPWRKVPIFKFQSKSSGKPMSFSTHVLPRLTTSSRAIWLGWVEAINGGPEVRYLVARSTDGGATFSEPASVHGDQAVRPGFTSLSVGADGTLCASWLDGRNQGQQPFLTVGSPATEGFAPEQLVFAGPEGKGICPCCDLAVARSAQGATYVAFRNNDSGNRDICIARSESGGSTGFEAPVPVTSDHWKFEGCPHDGPSLAMRGNRLDLLWMDAHSGQNRVYFASSPLPSLQFSTRELNPAARGAQGHPKLVASSSGALHAVWDESLDSSGPAPAPSAGHGEPGGHSAHGGSPVGSDRAIMYASSNTNGEFGPARAVAAHDGAFQLNPAIAIGPKGDVFIAWNELDTEGKQVVLVRLPPQNLPR